MIMGEGRRNITINDVAREAGVSITTVSRVLNNNYPVKKDTREKIEKAIEKLQYKPNIMARGLIIKRTQVIGVIVPGLTNLFFPMVVEAIDGIVKDKGYSISLNNTGGNAETERILINRMVSMQVDGIIAIDPAVENLDNGFYEEISEKLPVIIVNADSKRSNLNFVNYNEETGTKEAFEHLIKLGHKRIAFIRGDRSFSYDLKEKIYIDVLNKHKLDYRKIIRIENGNSIGAVEEGEDKVQELLGMNERPTAIFACNELMAVGAIGACNSLDIRIPDDISIIGFDNTLISKISYPRLTTVDLKINEVGKRAAEEILNVIENGVDSKIKIVVNTSLVVRESCKSIIK